MRARPKSIGVREIKADFRLGTNNISKLDSSVAVEAEIAVTLEKPHVPDEAWDIPRAPGRRMGKTSTSPCCRR